MHSRGTGDTEVMPYGPGIVYPERRVRMRPLFFGGRLLIRRAGEKEAFILAMICALDMYTTLWWVVNGEAMEANPLLAWTFHHHPIWFVFLKCATFLPALAAVPYLGRRHPKFTPWLLRCAILVYLGMYSIGLN